jgi:hypothetical protein
VKAQLPGAKRGVLGLPLLGEPLDRARREPRGVLSEQIPERRSEVPGREAVQVEDRQHLGHLRRAPRARRQDLRAKPPALPALLIDAPVVDPWRPDRDRPGPDRQLLLTSATIANHQPLPALIDLLDERADVLVDLRLQRRGDHPASTLPRQIIERDRTLNLLPDGEPANIRHGVPSCRPSPASVFINREGTPPSPSRPSTTSGYSSSASDSAASRRCVHTRRPRHTGST